MIFTPGTGFRPSSSHAFASKTTDETVIERSKLEQKEDLFESFKPKKVDKSNNGKFDISEAAKNFAKGMFSPVMAMVKHPVVALGMVAATVVATTLVPVLAPVMAVGFGVYSLYQVGKGTSEAIKNYKKGDYDAAEKSFDKIGQGVVGTAMSAMGVKQSAKIAKEAKMMSELKVDTLSNAQKATIETEVNNGGFIGALRDNVKVLTTKSGLKSIAYQFKPSMIKARALDVFNKVKGNNLIEEEREIQKTVDREVKTKEYREVLAQEFEKSPEGIRRAGLTDEQIEKEVIALYDEAFDKLGVSKELRPKIELQKGSDGHGGSYTQGRHRIEINPQSYRKGRFELEDIVMHEATHCDEAILRAGIPQERVNQIVKEELISRIMNGENEEVMVDWCLFADTMKPPKMSPKMKKEFVEFAEAELFQPEHKNLGQYVRKCHNQAYSAEDVLKARNDASPFLKKVQALIDNNPDFVAQYGSNEEALKALASYSRAHNYRYNSFIKVKIDSGKGTLFEPKYLDIPELSGEKLLKAEQSLRDNITTVEGNARVQTIENSILGGRKDFNQYQFSPEEVLAQQKGNGFLAEKYTAKVAEMRASGSINPIEEYRLNEVIRRANATIEYKTKGLEYYKKYTEMINHPENKELAEAVKVLEKELFRLEKAAERSRFELAEVEVTKMEKAVITEIIKVMVNRPYAEKRIPDEAIYNMLAIINNQDKKVA